jgi:hypothetical protein
LDRVRKTVHLCFAPGWVGSESPAHWNGDVFVTPEAWERYSEEQRTFMPSPMKHGERHPEERSIKALIAQIEELSKANDELRAILERKKSKGLFQRLLGL